MKIEIENKVVAMLFSKDDEMRELGEFLLRELIITEFKGKVTIYTEEYPIREITIFDRASLEVKFNILRDELKRILSWTWSK